MAENKIILSYHDALLKQSDVDLLTGPFWLNDQIISFYFEYLSRDVYKDDDSYLFISPEVTQCLKLVSGPEVEIFLAPLNATDKRIAFFALNDNMRNAAGGSHWSLLVWVKPVQTFYHFDSATPSNKEVSQSIVEKIKGYFACPGGLLKEGKCLQQSNSYDCGVHVIAQAEFLAKLLLKQNDLDAVNLVQRQIVNHKREHILSLIETLSEGAGD